MKKAFVLALALCALGATAQERWGRINCDARDANGNPICVRSVVPSKPASAPVAASAPASSASAPSKCEELTADATRQERQRCLKK